MLCVKYTGIFNLFFAKNISMTGCCGSRGVGQVGHAGLVRRFMVRGGGWLFGVEVFCVRVAFTDLPSKICRRESSFKFHGQDWLCTFRIPSYFYHEGHEEHEGV